ncbi:hypothetical protein BH24ACI3_BH24ACI3_07440 [soil metagenome]
MNPVVKNILAVVAGIVGGSVVNMGIISISGALIQPPPGADVTTMEGLTAAMPLMEPKHFLLPFLAHALGAFVGAFIAAFIAESRKMTFALGIGVFFLLGGIAAAFMIPAPMWFIAADLIVAYIPMAYLGGRLAAGNDQAGA